MLSLAGRVPEELFEHILSYFSLHVRKSEISGSSPVEFILSKRELGQFASVCRYWAKICQPILFEVIKLSSEQDFLELVAIASSQHSEIASYIRCLSLVYAFPCIPWIHVASLKCTQLFSRYTFSTLTIEGPLALEHLPKSLHSPLPRHIPAFSRLICYVSLVRIKFQSLKDVLQLTAELRSLRNLTCEDLSWVIAPSQESDLRFLYTGRSRCRMISIGCSMSRCPDSWIAPALSHTLRRAPDFQLNPADLLIACMMVRTTTNGQSGSAAPDTVSADVFAHGIDIWCGWYSNGYASRISFVTMSASHRHVIRKLELAFDAGEMFSTHILRDVAWDQIDQLAKGLSVIPHFTVNLKSVRDFLRFAEVVAPCLPLLAYENKLRYIVQVTPSEWFQGTLAEIEMKLKNWNER